MLQRCNFSLITFSCWVWQKVGLCGFRLSLWWLLWTLGAFCFAMMYFVTSCKGAKKTTFSSAFFSLNFYSSWKNWSAFNFETNPFFVALCPYSKHDYFFLQKVEIGSMHFYVVLLKQLFFFRFSFLFSLPRTFLVVWALLVARKNNCVDKIEDGKICGSPRRRDRIEKCEFGVFELACILFFLCFKKYHM